MRQEGLGPWPRRREHDANGKSDSTKARDGTWVRGGDLGLRIDRKWLTPQSTIGELTVDGVFECFTLEDVVRVGDIFQVKVPGATAIPEGRYPVKVSFSPRFKRELPEILDVPDFTGVRIHPGNVAADTDGCVLVGRARAVDRVLQSVDAFVALFDKIRVGLHGGPVMLTIVNVAPVESPVLKV